MKKIIMEYKNKLILSSLVILLPILTTLLTQGTLTVYPLLLLLTHWFIVLLVSYDQRNRNQSPKVMGLFFWIFPVTSLLIGAILSLSQTEVDLSSVTATLLFFFFGLLFTVLGNYLPKFRQNRTMGIKVKWTLENEENWNATHRASGKLWVVCGLLCMACSLFPNTNLTMLLFFLVVPVAVFLPCLYSYCYYRKQLREEKLEKIPTNAKTTAFTLLAVLATILFTVWVLFAGNMEVVYDETVFTVVTDSWKDLTIAYEDIEQMIYQEQDPSTEASDGRVNGFGNLRMAMGSFHNDLYGSYTRYTYVSCPACIVLTVNGETIVLNGRDEAHTKELYDTLEDRIR